MKSFVRESSQSKYRTLELSADDMSINEEISFAIKGLRTPFI
jgi:hypothetical protein